MDMFEGVGRRLDQKTGQLVDIGQNSLNGKERKVLFRQNDDATFTDVAFVNGADRDEDGRGLSIVDYDNDGQMDLVLRNYKQPTQLLRNLGGPNHWIQLKLVGTKSNRDAVGARVRLRTEAGWQTREVGAGSAFLSGSTLVQHFGLGNEIGALEVAIRWPSGAESRFEKLDGDRRYVVTEGKSEPVPIRR